MSCSLLPFPGLPQSKHDQVQKKLESVQKQLEEAQQLVQLREMKISGSEGGRASVWGHACFRGPARATGPALPAQWGSREGGGWVPWAAQLPCSAPSCPCTALSWVWMGGKAGFLPMGAAGTCPVLPAAQCLKHLWE